VSQNKNTKNIRVMLPFQIVSRQLLRDHIKLKMEIIFDVPATNIIDGMK